MASAKITTTHVTRSVDMKLPLNQAKLTVGYIFKIIFWYILVISVCQNPYMAEEK